MRIYLTLFLLCIMISCKKDFKSCDGFENLLGQWISINEEFEQTLLIKKNGKIVFNNYLERRLVLNSDYCEKKSGYILMIDQKSNTSFFIGVSSNFDTISIPGGGATNPQNDEIGYHAYFIKK